MFLMLTITRMRLLLQQRLANETTTVGGWTLPRGTWMYLNVLAMHKNPKYFPEPEVRHAACAES